METNDTLVFPGYMHVPKLDHAIHGSEIFFLSHDDYLSAIESCSGVPSSHYRLAPDHWNFLLTLGASASVKTAFGMPSSTSEAPKLLDASHLSNESTSSTATTVPFISPSEEFPPLHSSNPRWKENVQNFAQSKSISAIADMCFNISLFEKLILERIINSTLPFDAHQTATAVNLIFRHCSSSSPARDSHPSSKKENIGKRSCFPFRMKLKISRYVKF
jgi:hypothetical protein